MILDIVVLAVLLISAVIAFLRGFIREVLTILGVVGGLAAAYAGAPYLLPFMQNWLGVEEGVEPERLFGILPYTLLADILSYGLIFIVVVILLSLLSHMMAEAVKSLGLGAVDRSLGVIFGLARGLVLLGLLYLPVHLLVDKETKAGWFGGSKTQFYLEQTSAYMSDLLPEGAFERVEEKANDVVKDGAREQLQGIDLLQKEKEGTTEPAPGPDEGTDGYTDSFREQMDELFQEETDNRPGAGNE